MSSSVRRLAVGLAALAAAATAVPSLHASPARERTPGAAAGCPSLAGVTSFHGGAVMLFSKTARGPETGGLKGGEDRVTLRRAATNLVISLTAKKTLSSAIYPGIVVFAGKSHGGTVAVHDKMVKTDAGGHPAVLDKVTAAGARPSFVSAALFFDTVRCKYQLQVSYGVRTTKGGVSGGAYSEQEPIPGDLHLSGGAGPSAYLTCPGNPLLTGKPCYQFGGGLAVDFSELVQCKRDPPGNCQEKDGQPLGDASFNWYLKPTFASK